MTRVAISSVGSDVDAAFARAMRLSDCEGLIRRGDSVLIKPNWNAVGTAGSTSLGVVQAACRWAREQGAGEVIVGEGPVPVSRAQIEAYLKELGVPGSITELGARFVLFDDDEHVLYSDEPDLPPEIGIARLALEADILMNIPLMKVHSTCVTTLCVKNLKGCLRPQDKMAFHRVGLLPAIVALNRIVRPQINVIDAINAMEGEHNRGPLVPLGLLIAGQDRVAVDAVGCAQMGIDPADVPLLRMAARAGLGEDRLSGIEIAGEPLQPRRFVLPQEHISRVYPDLEIDDGDACTACRAALMDGLFVAGNGRRVTSVALGAKADPAPGALVVGNCLRKFWPTHPHVEGCPPSGHAVAAALCRGGDET